VLFNNDNGPEFRGDSIEIDMVKRAECAPTWRMRMVRVAGPAKRSRGAMPITVTQMWVRGPQLPEEVESADLLTPEDHRDLTLDHIARTSDVVAHLEIRKLA
jgi:hypothetical protein